MKGKMAIIGDGDSVLVFSSIGVDAYPVQNSENAESVLKKIASKYQIRFITDDVAKQIDETISRYITSPFSSSIGLTTWGCTRYPPLTTAQHAARICIGVTENV